MPAAQAKTVFPKRTVLQVLYAWRLPFPPALIKHSDDAAMWYWQQASNTHVRGA